MCKILYCSSCGKEREKGRKQCKPCYLEIARKRQANRFLLNGRHYFKFNCVGCDKEFKAWRRTQIICPDCFDRSTKQNNELAEVNYVFLHSKHEHRLIAKSILGRELEKDEVVHHIDENPKNNNLDNLMILTIKDHASLHAYLHRKLNILRAMQKFDEWEKDRIKLSFKFLEDKKIKYTILSTLKSTN